ncbi:MAG: zinc metallopeptidase [Actinomycetia bacterium]|nr:zinc metallopeptidase [Actinomycetes bacterium]
MPLALDPMYLLLIAVSVVLGLATQAYIRSQYKKFSKVDISTGLTGAQAARKMLDANGLSNVAIQAVPGTLSDHFDPRTNVVSLSEDVFNGRSVAATAIACHECGHAVQHARKYVPEVLRNSIFPVVNIASNLWFIVFIIGIFLGITGFIWLAVILFAAVLAFQLVTLPVELNASRRAMAHVSIGSYLPAAETKGARKVLTAAALTYVAAALVSVLQLLYLLGAARR